MVIVAMYPMFTNRFFMSSAKQNRINNDAAWGDAIVRVDDTIVAFSTVVSATKDFLQLSKIRSLNN